MDEQKILQALDDAALAAIEACSQPLSIKAMGRTLDDPTQKYFELVRITNNRNGDFWGNERIYQGIYRVLLHWPVDDQGVYEPTSLLGEIGDAFPKDKAWFVGDVRVSVYDVPDFSGPVENGSELLFSLTLRYMCFRS